MNKKEQLLTAEMVRRLLRYDPSTGIFYWKIACSRYKKGAVAGSIRRDGHVKIGIGGTTYYAHRLAWLYVHGHWPKKGLDHRVGASKGNSIANIREASQSQNMMNRLPWKRKYDLPRGVTQKRTRYKAAIVVNKKSIYLGSYGTPEEAGTAYSVASIKYHGEFSYLKRMV